MTCASEGKVNFIPRMLGMCLGHPYRWTMIILFLYFVYDEILQERVKY